MRNEVLPNFDSFPCWRREYILAITNFHSMNGKSNTQNEEIPLDIDLSDQTVDLSRMVTKPDFCLCENKGADQLRGNREADQRLCFRYTDSTIPLLLKSEISSF